MNIKLNSLKIENFKGIKSFEVELDGENATIIAENGIGKTTVYDAFLWLLFGKNSEGKKDFEVRPLDENNQPIKGLVLAVVAEIDCDGTVHTFRKEQHEKVVKEQLRGYETLCTIDEVPKKVGEYQDYITELIPEDTFKLLTDLHHFNSKLHWQNRRKVLLDIAGKIGTPEGFDELLAALNGRSIEEYKSVLSGQKKRHVKERDEINPRIDEIHRTFEDFAETDTKSIEHKREELKGEIAHYDGERQGLFDTEKQRQEKVALVNELTKKRGQREVELASDTTGIKSLLDEKGKIVAEVGVRQQIVVGTKTNWTTLQTDLSVTKNKLDALMVSINSIREEYKTASEAMTDDRCYACGQQLPAANVIEMEKKRKAELAEITKRGNTIQADVDKCKTLITEAEARLIELTDALGKATAELQTAQQAKDKRFAEIDKQIKANETISPDTDKTWRIFNDQIQKIEDGIGEPVADQLQEIDNQRTEKVEAIAQLDKTLAQADRMKQDKLRITELEEKEKELAQQIANVEEQLAEIDKYKATESRMIEESVNSKFKYVTFKLFNQLLNGSIEDTCEATLNGVPCADISYGQRIRVGLDVINTLSAHYDISTPIFIDNAEGLTYPVETQSQIIRLEAVDGVKQLSVTVKKGAIAHG